MAKTEPRTLSGFMELLPNDQILFNQMMNTIEETYQRFGFLPLDTPIIELSEVLLAKAGGETEKQIYRFNRGDNDLSLRFDLTVPLAKYVAKNYGNLSFPFRRYQIGKVYRGERTQKGRFKGLKLSQGIKLNVWRDGKTGKVNIMKDGRLKWFETGTQKRRTTYTNKRKAHSTGQIKPSHFFTNAKKTTEKEIFTNLDNSLMQSIKKTWDKAQLM